MLIFFWSSDHFPETASDEISRESQFFVCSAVNVADKHVHVPVVPILRQFQQLIESPGLGQQRPQAPKGTAAEGTSPYSLTQIITFYLKIATLEKDIPYRGL